MDMAYYRESCEKAILLDYQAIKDPNAYLGISFVKDDKKWIHDIEALAVSLGVSTEESLEKLGYNCKDYWTYRNLSVSQIVDMIYREEMLEIFGGGVFDEFGMTYISDGVYMTEDGDLIDKKGE